MTWFAVAAWTAAAITVVGGAADAKQQRETGRANQQIAENNARMADANAQDTAVLAARDDQQSVWRTRALIGQQKATIAANGLDMDIGTPLDILGESGLMGGADRSAIQMDAARKAWGFQGEALNYRNQGTQANWQGQVGSKTTILKTIGSAVGTVAGGYSGRASAGGGATSGRWY